MIRTVAKIFAGVALIVGTIVLPATSASASGEGVNMNEACQIQYGAGWYAQLTYPSEGAYGWQCWVPPYGIRKGVSVEGYCQYFYSENAYNTGGAYSWYCA
jgi:hypothetical protein